MKEWVSYDFDFGGDLNIAWLVGSLFCNDDNSIVCQKYEVIPRWHEYFPYQLLIFILLDLLLEVQIRMLHNDKFTI